MEICEELKEHRSENCVVHRLVNRSIFGASKREFIDKKIFFQDGEDFYMWITSVPDVIYDCEPPHLRSYCIVGINKIGKLADGGCYLHVISQSDLKVSNWIINSIIPMMPSKMMEWGANLREFANSK